MALTDIIRTVCVAVLASSSLYPGIIRRRVALVFDGQWHASHVCEAGTSRLLSRPDAMGREKLLNVTSLNCRTPAILLCSQPVAPGATWHSTQATWACGAFSCDINSGCRTWQLCPQNCTVSMCST